MQELEKMINVYHIGFTVCLILSCVFFIVSVILFFKFDIRKIIDMKTGRGAKKTIQKMEEINAKTGKLRQDMVSHTPSVLRSEDRIAYPVTEANLDVQAEAARQRNSGAGRMSEDKNTAQNAYTESLEEGAQDTTLLCQSGETTLLAQNMQQQIQQREIKLPGAFKIEKEIMWIHTEEVL